MKTIKCGKDSPCFCGSSKTYGTCCGATLGNGEGVLVKLNEEDSASVKFIPMKSPSKIVPEASFDMLRDDQNRILVYSSRDDAWKAIQALGLNVGEYSVGGMSEEKWKEFQINFPDHVLMTEATPPQMSLEEETERAAAMVRVGGTMFHCQDCQVSGVIDPSSPLAKMAKMMAVRNGGTFAVMFFSKTQGCPNCNPEPINAIVRFMESPAMKEKLSKLTEAVGKLHKSVMN